MTLEIEKTIENLKGRGFGAFYAENSAEALELVKGMVPEGSTIANGGSQTLKQTGIMDWFLRGNYDYAPHGAAGETPEEEERSYKSAFTCDYYLMSTNAVTEEGELYNVDGRGNRVSSLCYGPEHVIVIAGKNKVVPTLEDAVNRVKTVAAPKNGRRLGVKTPCAIVGSCADCRSPQRMCCHRVITSFCRTPGRISVIIVGEDLGY
ncbi:MAG: lactate utilization protein [Oscillospiraceae bacterium]|jgi:hypothetical protein